MDDKCFEIDKKEGCARAAAWRAVQKYPSVQQLAKHAEFVFFCKNLISEIMGLYLNPNADAFFTVHRSRQC